MQREKPWLQRDALCGNVVRNTHLVRTFHVESRHSSSTYSLTAIRPRTNGAVVELGSSFLETTPAMERTEHLQEQRVASNCNLFAEIGCLVPPRVHTYSDAARGMVTRRGSGHVKHLRIENTLVSGNDRARALRTDHSAQRTETRRHRHEDTEGRQKRSSPRAAWN